MKNLVTISLIIFVTAVVVILGAGVFMNQNKTVNSTPTQQSSQTQISSGVIQNANQASGAIAIDEVAKHNIASDCWEAVNGSVYNVTSLIPVHTGGPDKILAFCGKDASNVFNARGVKGPHSQRAQQVLNNYYVGPLK